MALALLGVKYKSDKRDQYLHHGNWMVKLGLWLFFSALPFFFPNGMVNVYGESCTASASLAATVLRHPNANEFVALNCVPYLLADLGWVKHLSVQAFTAVSSDNSHILQALWHALARAPSLWCRWSSCWTSRRRGTTPGEHPDLINVCMKLQQTSETSGNVRHSLPANLMAVYSN